MKRRTVLTLASSTFFGGCLEKQPAVEVVDAHIIEQKCTLGDDMADIKRILSDEIEIYGELHSEMISQEIFVNPYTGSNNVDYMILAIESISSERSCSERNNTIRYDATVRFDSMPPEIQVSHYVDGELSEGIVNSKDIS